MPYIALPHFDNHDGMSAHRKPGVTAVRRKKLLLLSYAPDWAITIILAALFYSLNNVDGFKREFSLSDTSLRHPYAVHERVPNFALYLISFAAPLILQSIMNFITVRSWWDFHNSTLGLVLGLSLAGSITQFTKITVGRPRPDVIDRCQPTVGSVDPTYGLSSVAICTQTDSAILRDGFRSFPSGHSSMSFAGLGFLAFYLAGKLHLFDTRGHVGKAWISLTPFAGAALVAISRTMDYRHHWQDVLVGSLLGVATSYFSYRQYYPSLASDLSNRPYSPRIKLEAEGDLLPLHHSRRTSSTSQSGAAGLGHGGHSHGSSRRYTDDPSSPFNSDAEGRESYDGLVDRPAVEPLRDVWNEGEEVVPRSQSPQAFDISHHNR